MRRRTVGIASCGLLLLVGGGLYVLTSDDRQASSTEVEPAEDSVTALSDPPPAATHDFTATKEFTPDQFKQAYDSLSHPNIRQIIVAPDITGNSAADARIRELAEARGYQLRHVATTTLTSEVDGQPLQYLLIEDWQALQLAAEAENVSMSINSGYRSVAEQTELFVSRLLAAGATISDVAAGSADAIVNEVLSVTAPPGYSRHHSGYTIDLEDAFSPVFGGSASYRWLSNNNFEIAKQHGFIPSYPEGLENQGPDPEEWEFVWVGKPSTFE